MWHLPSWPSITIISAFYVGPILVNANANYDVQFNLNLWTGRTLFSIQSFLYFIIMFWMRAF